ncbi:MAG: lipoprotein [Verrucomicrobiota bacterium]|jgi:TPR repeat protein
MKLPLLATLLSTVLLASAAEPPVEALTLFGLSARWAKRPIADLEADAARGDAVAQFYLGQLLLTGLRVPRDATRGLTLLQQAAAQDNAEAMAELGRRQLFGEGLPENFDAALRLARAAASRSNGAGLHLLGQLQASGIGMEADAKAALKLYEQAVAVGSPLAMRTLGRAHLEGRHGFQPDAVEANRWYLRAAEAGHPAAMNAYGYSLFTGRGVPKDLPGGRSWMLRAAANGEGSALQTLSEQGQLDASTQRMGWREAARAGNADAQFRLARLLATGELEPQNATESPHHLLQLAAEGQHPEAALMLGDRYRWGYGCNRDLVLAARWLLSGGFRKFGTDNASATISEDPAQGSAIVNWFDDNGGKLKPRQTPEDRALAEAIHLYLRAHRQRDAEAMRELAGWYRRGYLVPSDLVQATAWLHLATTTGSAAAIKERDELETKLSAEQRHQARARSAQLILKF